MRHLPLLALLILAACGPDNDGDGSRRRDCNDNRPRVNPRATEICDGIDNDCDGWVDEGVSIAAWWDRDGDGFGDDEFGSRVCELPADAATVAGDCNDLDSQIHPDATEICNGEDDNCDRRVDEDVLLGFYVDGDGDGDGSGEPTAEGCAPTAGLSATATDCDDNDPEVSGLGQEVCDGKDNDCNGSIDDDAGARPGWFDADGDGYGDVNAPTYECGDGIVNNALDCDDTDASHSPATIEVAGNSLDDDCDGYIDEHAVPDHHATLADAVAAASDGDVVQLGNGTFFDTIDLTGRDITLAGNGCDSTSLYGDGDGTVVTLDAGAVERISVGGGSAEFGGGMLIGGDVALTEVCLQSNFATEEGGGIAITAGSTTLVDSWLVRNQASGDGGGIWVAPTAQLDVQRSAFVSNRGSRGGALAFENATGTLRSSWFADNVAHNAGGAISLRNPADGDDVPAVVTASNLTLVSNRAGQSGAATYNYRSDLTLDSSIAAFHDHNDTPIFYALSEENEDISLLSSWGNLGLEHRTGHNVDAIRADPLFVAHDPLTSPEAWDLRLSAGSPLIDAGSDARLDPDGSRSDMGAFGGPDAPSDFDWGWLDPDADGMPSGWEWRGGTNPWLDDALADPDADGLANQDELAAGTLPNVVDTDQDGVSDGDEVTSGQDPADPRDNAPVASAGRDRWVRLGDSVTLQGGGSFTPGISSPTIAWTVLEAPGSALPADPSSAVTTLVPDATGLWRLQISVDSGAATRSDEVLLHVVDGVVVPTDAATVQEAIALTPSGGYVLIEPGTYLENLVTIGKDIGFVGLGSEPGDVRLDGGGVGRVLTNDSDEAVTLARLTVTGGTASDGGGLFIDGSTSLRLDQVIVEDNHANLRGGGVYVRGTPVTITDSVFRDNTATDAAGLRVVSAPATVLRTLFTGNAADHYGGGLLTTSGSGFVHRIENSIFQRNSAELGAATVHFGSSTEQWLRNCAIVDNDATHSVVYAHAGELILENTVLAWNRAPYVAGRDEGTARLVPLFVDYGPASDELFDHAEDMLGDEWGSVHADPMVLSWSDDGDASNDLWAPLAASPLLDAGHPAQTDRDGTRVDIGPWGGPEAPLGVEAFTRDSDGDGMSDGWEQLYGLDPLSADATLDADGDGIDNATEFVLGTNPTLADSDTDGISDGDELTAGTNPADASDNKPTANAGSDARVRQGTPVALDGTASFDPNADPLAFDWQVEAAPVGSAITTASLDDATSQTPSFTPDVRGVYNLALVVSDANAASLPDRVRVEVYGDIAVPGDYPDIPSAVASLLDDDTIVLGAGEFQTLVESGDRRFTVRGAGSDQTTLRALPGQEAAVVTADGNLTLEALTVTGGTGDRGGGVACEDGELQLVDVLVWANAGYSGGGVGLESCVATFTDTTIDGNYAAFNGGALYAQSSTVTWAGGSASFNLAGASGGALHLVASNGAIDNLLLAHNDAGSSGGAVYQSGGLVTNHHMTVVHNSGSFGAWYVTGLGLGNLQHSIVAHNTGFGLYRTGSSTFAAVYNGWHGNSAAPSQPSSLSSSGTLNVHGDPRFAASGDHRLRWDSPMIDVGDPGCLDPDGSVCDFGVWSGPLAGPGYDAFYVDGDSNGLPDAFEVTYGVTDPSADPDGDNLDNAAELAAGTDPNRADTDGDGLTDDVDPDPVGSADHFPVADAGNNVITQVGVAASLDGSSSSDPNSDPLDHAWTLVSQPGRSTATSGDITGADTPSPSFTPDTPGAYVFELVVTDDDANSSPPDQTTMWVEGDVLVPDDYADLDTAIASVVSSYTVVVAAGTWPLHASLDGRSITIQGAGPDDTVLDGEGTGRVLDAPSNEDLVLRDLTLTGGLSEEGGGIRMLGGDLTLEGVALRHNQAVTGGAVFMLDGQLTATDVHITDNTSIRYGGGIYIEDGIVDVAGALFANNHAIELNGGALYAKSCDTDVHNSIFHDNGASYGGGLMVQSTSSEPKLATLTHLTGTWNRADNGGAFMRLSLNDATLHDSIVAFSRGGDAIYMATTTSGVFDQQRTLVYDATPAVYHNIASPIGSNGNIEANPQFLGVSDDGDWTNDDWHLAASSPAVDAALGLDADASPADMGAYGGSGGVWGL